MVLIMMVKPNDMPSYIDNNFGYLIAFLLGILIFRIRNIFFFFAKWILKLVKLLGRLSHHVVKSYIRVLGPISGSDIIFFGIFLMSIRDILTVVYPFDEYRQYIIYFWFTIFTSWFIFAGLVLYIFRRIYAEKK